SGLLYRTQSPTENLDFPAVDGGIATRLPVITIVNESSASAAEILAAVLKERGRSVIVGTPTYGKHLVQVPFDLHNGGMLRVSISRWVTPDGASVEGIGVTPNITLDLAPDLAVPELVEAVVAAAG
ncbi:MAG: S41 family peptidase, partial [Acidimicrobiia bacterium]